MRFAEPVGVKALQKGYCSCKANSPIFESNRWSKSAARCRRSTRRVGRVSVQNGAPGSDAAPIKSLVLSPQGNDVPRERMSSHRAARGAGRSGTAGQPADSQNRASRRVIRDRNRMRACGCQRKHRAGSFRRVGASRKVAKGLVGNRLRHSRAANLSDYGADFLGWRSADSRTVRDDELDRRYLGFCH